ncbi:VPLPA-CTERM sorting domain-containing protein [Roseovarius aestuariivivens]|uniref:VPLPA-CTERM sorting domain-containing protein n=1 Tax=Roseovarius aestuariivivens TaxID=1888910 RepID=UPI00108056E0|nr:VPLPA-CTERM sorting domain-containing protein [Roseovarius aestuariivivens]
MNTLTKTCFALPLALALSAGTASALTVTALDANVTSSAFVSVSGGASASTSQTGTWTNPLDPLSAFTDVTTFTPGGAFANAGSTLSANFVSAAQGSFGIVDAGWTSSSDITPGSANLIGSGFYYQFSLDDAARLTIDFDIFADAANTTSFGLQGVVLQELAPGVSGQNLANATDPSVTTTLIYDLAAGVYEIDIDLVSNVSGGVPKFSQFDGTIDWEIEALNAVPLPAGMVLLLSGAFALYGLRRRKT